MGRPKKKTEITEIHSEQLARITEILKNIVDILEQQPEQEEKLLPELPPLTEPPVPKCQRCGHIKEEHEPLKANNCFVLDCQCKGWKE